MNDSDSSINSPPEQRPQWRSRMPWLRLDLVLFVLSIGVFLLWPRLDVYFTSLFWENGEFIHADNAVVVGLYWIFAKIQFPYLLILFGLLYWAWHKKNPQLRKKTAYLLITLILGPGILVNVILKDNSLGRPRPHQTQTFNGEHEYTAPLHYSGACPRNCSFVSGHAAIAFFTLALAWVTGRRRWLYIGVLMGAVLGGVRILQGGHFLSDVVFAGWAVYFTCWGIATLMKIPYPSTNRFSS